DAAAQDIGAETLATARTLPAADPTVQASPQTRVSQPATKVAALPAAKPEAARSTRRIWFALGGVLLLAVILVATIAGFNAAGGGEEAPIALAASPTEVQATETPTPTEPAPSPTPPEPTPTAIPATPTGTPTPEPDPSPTEIAPPTPTSTLAAPIIGGADKIAFVADGDIWAANLDGSDRTQLTTDGGLKFNLEWDPDGQSVIFITGLCIKSVNFDLVVDIIVCFKSIDLLEGFEVSPDGQQIAISLDREIYIVPFDLEALNPGKDLNRNDLIQMATCEYLAPYNRNAVKGVHWSNDGQQIALMILGTGTGATQGLQVDLIQILDISKCVEKPPKLDGFPASRFSIEGYETTPLIPDWDWDGEALFTMNSLKRNGGFGDLYSYNAVRHTGEKINPLQGKCCYRGGRWSPDGRYLLFAFQEFSPDSVTIFYYVPFATLNTGTDLVPLSIPALTNPKEFPQPALRPAQTP
ncbi:MAG: TolB family protein, partial [Anaerolineales bacterium]